MRESEKTEKLATGGTEPKGEERGKGPARNGLGIPFRENKKSQGGDLFIIM